MKFNLTPWHHSDAARQQQSVFSSLQNEINRSFDDFFNGSQEPEMFNSAWMNNRFASPVIDIVENDKNFKLEAELPGLELDDVEVTVNDNNLTIKAEKKTAKEDKDKNYVHRERYYGTYERMITLPDTADTGSAKATFKKGVLCLDIPKKEGAIKAAKKIKIKQAA